MSRLNTFDIKQEYIALEAMLNEYDEETGEVLNNAEDIKEYIEMLDSNRDEKLDNIERLKRDNLSKVEALANEVKRLTAFKKQYEATNERLTDLQYTLTGGEKLETEFYKFGTRTSSSVQVTDEDALDFEYLVVKTESAPDKKAIKEALKKGVEVAGAEMVTKIALSVR